MSAATDAVVAPSLSGRRTGAMVRERLFELAMLLALLIALGILLILIIEILQGAVPFLQDRGSDFLTSKLSSRATRTGLIQALVGSLQIGALTAVIAFPFGIATAVYLEEYAADNWFTRLVDVNVRNLAGVPSVVYGLLGFAIFVGVLRPVTGGNTVLAAGITMGLLVLPIVVITAAEAIRAVPQDRRLGGYGLGATRWEVTRKLVLPSAIPGILTGLILALARGLGETAPLIVVGAATFLTLDPDLFALRHEFTALPVVVYQWASLPQAVFREQAAPAAILVLLVFTLSLNAVAILLRNRFEKRAVN